MKKIIKILLILIVLISCNLNKIQAQTPWILGGNWLVGGEKLGSTQIRH